MPTYVKLYFATDDSEVSSKGDFTNPVEFRLRLDLEETDEVRLYAMAEPGYKITNATVEPVSANGPATTDKWALAPDVAGSPGEYGAWGALLSLGEIAAGEFGRVYFWVKAKATSDESVANDASVALQIEGIAEAV